MPNSQDPNFNKNVSMVYVEEIGFTGYKGLDFTKLDNIEDILRQGVVISGSLADSAYISGIKINTDNIGAIKTGIDSIDSRIDSIDNKLFVTGDAFPAGVQGTIVFQADLTPQFDGVMTYQADTAGNGKVIFNNSFVSLPNTGYIKNVTFINASNSTIEVKQDNTFDFGVPIPANTTLVFNGVTGLQQLSARRFDQAAQPPLTGYFRWEAWRKNSIIN
jgi:hypothetical protein